MPVSRILTRESREPAAQRASDDPGSRRGSIVTAALALSTTLVLVAAPAAEALGLL